MSSHICRGWWLRLVGRKHVVDMVGGRTRHHVWVPHIHRFKFTNYNRRALGRLFYGSIASQFSCFFPLRVFDDLNFLFRLTMSIIHQLFIPRLHISVSNIELEHRRLTAHRPELRVDHKWLSGRHSLNFNFLKVSINVIYTATLQSFGAIHVRIDVLNRFILFRVLF